MSTYPGWYLKAWLGSHTFMVHAFIQAEGDKEPKKINKNPFSYIEDNTISDNKAMRNTAMSFYQLMIVFAVIGTMTSLTFAGYKLMFAKSGNDTSEAKKSILIKMLLQVMVFGFVGILGIIFEVTKSLA